MKTIRIFRHVECEGPAHLATLLQQKQCDYELVRIDAGEPINTELNDTAGLIFMGGSMSVNDDLPWLAQEMALIRAAMAQDIPVLGVCLGSQLLAKALGACVYAGPCMEIGWADVSVTAAHALSNALPETLEVFHWHGETFDLPAGATLLFGNARYAHQGFAIGPHLGLQFHVEMTAPLIREWVARFPADIARRCDAQHDAQAILHDLDARVLRLQQHAATLFNNWLSNCRFD